MALVKMADTVVAMMARRRLELVLISSLIFDQALVAQLQSSRSNKMHDRPCPFCTASQISYINSKLFIEENEIKRVLGPIILSSGLTNSSVSIGIIIFKCCNPTHL